MNPLQRYKVFLRYATTFGHIFYFMHAFGTVGKKYIPLRIFKGGNDY